MAEFKAQILGVIIVLSIFAVLNTSVRDFFQNTWQTVTTQITEMLGQIDTGSSQ